MLLEKEITEKLEKIEGICGDKNPEEMNEEERRKALCLIISANNFYGLLIQQKGNKYRVDLTDRIKNISNKLINYES